MRRKCPRLLSQIITLLHDNGTARTTQLIEALLKDFGWLVFPHPPYLPDCAPTDFHFFPFLKQVLCGLCFSCNTDLEEFVGNNLSNLGTQSYYDGIQKLIPRHNKCSNRIGNYVEKWLYHTTYANKFFGHFFHVCERGKVTFLTTLVRLSNFLCILEIFLISQIFPFVPQNLLTNL